MAAGKPLIAIEGDEALTRALARMEAKALKQVMPKAAKASADIVQADFKQRSPKKSGLMRRSTSKRVRKYKHIQLGERITRGGRSFRVKRVTAEDIGASVIYDRKKIERHLRKSGRKLTEDKKRGGPFLYPFTVELGRRGKTGQRPLTKALYQNQQQIRQRFLAELRYLVSNPKA